MFSNNLPKFPPFSLCFWQKFQALLYEAECTIRYMLARAYSDYSSLHAYSHSLIRDLIFRLKELWTVGVHQRLCSDCADAQADLGLDKFKVTFAG